MTVEKIVMVPTAMSPPYFSRERLKDMVRILSVICMTQGDRPRASAGRSRCGTGLGYNRGGSRSFYPHVKKKNKHRVKDYVQTGSGQHGNQAGSCESLGIDEIYKSCAEFYKYGSENIEIEIIQRICQRILACSEQQQDISGKYASGRGQDDAEPEEKHGAAPQCVLGGF